MGVPSDAMRITGLSSLMSVLPAMCFTHRSLWVLLPCPLLPRNIYALPPFSTVEECMSRVLWGAVLIVKMSITLLLSPKSTCSWLPRVVIV